MRVATRRPHGEGARSPSGRRSDSGRVPAGGQVSGHRDGAPWGWGMGPSQPRKPAVQGWPCNPGSATATARVVGVQGGGCRATSPANPGSSHRQPGPAGGGERDGWLRVHTHTPVPPTWPPGPPSQPLPEHRPRGRRRALAGGERALDTPTHVAAGAREDLADPARTLGGKKPCEGPHANSSFFCRNRSYFPTRVSGKGAPGGTAGAAPEAGFPCALPP